MVHLTTRQGFEIPGISFAHMDEINKMLSPLIAELEVKIGVKIDDPAQGYPAAGTRNVVACIGCGECVLKCPASAWIRGGQNYRVVIMGRTGKKNPRLAAGFLEWAEREVVLKICANLYQYIDKYIDRSLPKEHVGYIVDRTGYNVFKEEVLRDLNLGSKTKVASFLDFAGNMYEKNVVFESNS